MANSFLRRALLHLIFPVASIPLNGLVHLSPPPLTGHNDSINPWVCLPGKFSSELIVLMERDRYVTVLG
ncbi:MAG: hypothetical protein F6K50_43445 [Moorea sp. SIO3I7]|uniref:hypothetical protein n=1 Tax=Moorena sp. SIO3I6 TaxID=2607831 RepID=UPI0013CBBC5E|nr:hypothetical protein [Moorena sp. SIO3I6]NEO01995.1 hypothetical protein [Moorena sp. SIO3I7]NEP27534.1 hypothetical protein [Moorena sp. SIO3I6]